MVKPFSTHPVYPLALAAALLAGCSAAPKIDVPDDDQIDKRISIELLISKAEDASAKGNLIISAQTYLQLADMTEPPERVDHLLSAATALTKSRQTERAQAVIANVDPHTLTPSQYVRYQLLFARLSLLAQQPVPALARLQSVEYNLPNEMRAEWHNLRAEAYSQSGNHLEAARERIYVEPLLSDDLALERNQQLIWSSLNQLSGSALITFRDQPPPDVLSGWLELAYFAKSSVDAPDRLAMQIDQWRQRYPEHPAAGNFIEGLLAYHEALTRRPDSIALLLPLTGAFSAPANAVRDGFMAAYYARENLRYTPSIRIYDTGEDLESGISVYHQAIADGAEFVVGPLRKPLVEELSQLEEVPVTTLALNYLGSDEIHIENLYQFGLLPEDEARQVAERAWLDGHDKALVLAPHGEWGDRMLGTFVKHWQQLDGNMIEIQRYDASKHDFSKPVVELLNIDDSKQRRRELQSLLGMKLEFEPRRREDVDFIFVAAFPGQARQIRPQLKFYYASDIPVYSTSHAYSGDLNTTLDRDMDGIAFCDMPWVLEAGSDKQPNWQDFTRIWNANATPFKRLYAMGVDAYQLVSQLGRLHDEMQTQIPANTGNLYVDGSNRIHRQLLWAHFRRGKPVLLDNPNSL